MTKCFGSKSQIQRSLVGDRQSKVVFGAITNAPTTNVPIIIKMTCLVCGAMTIVCTTNVLLQSCHFKFKKM